MGSVQTATGRARRVGNIEEAPLTTSSEVSQTVLLPHGAAPPSEPLPQLPDYAFLKVIGRGAFGTVWLAEERLSGVFRAIKVLRLRREKTAAQERPSDAHANEAHSRESVDETLARECANEAHSHEHASEAQSHANANEAHSRESADETLSRECANEAHSHEHASEAQSHANANEVHSRESVDETLARECANEEHTHECANKPTDQPPSPDATKPTSADSLTAKDDSSDGAAAYPWALGGMPRDAKDRRNADEQRNAENRAAANDRRDSPPSRVDRELAGIHAYQVLAKDHPHLIRILKTGVCTLAEPTDPNRDRDDQSRDREGVEVPNRDHDDPNRDREGAAESEPSEPGRPRPRRSAEAGAERRGGGPPGSRDAEKPPRPHHAVYYVMEIADHAGGPQPHHPLDYHPLTLATLLRQRGRLPTTARPPERPLVRESLLAPSASQAHESALSLARESLLAPTPFGVVECAGALLDAIDHLHKAGLHHRDIKPNNVLFVHGVLKLGDLGLAASDNDEPVGTPGYLPPAPATRVRAENGDAVASPPRGRRERGAGAPTGNMPTRASAPQEATAPQVTASRIPRRPQGADATPPGTPFGPPDDLYALGKVMYEMTTGLPAASFPEWPADLDPAADPLLPRLRELINDLCHPSAERRQSFTAQGGLRELRHRLASIQSGPPMLHTTRRRAKVALTTIAAIALALGIGADYFGAWWMDPFRPQFTERAYDGTQVNQTLTTAGYRFGLGRNHPPDVPKSITNGENMVVEFGDIQTRLGGAVYYKRTIIEDDVLIGGHVAMAGVHVKRGAVIGAGSIVLPESEIGENEYWSGNPARRRSVLSPPGERTTAPSDAKITV